MGDDVVLLDKSGWLTLGYSWEREEKNGTTGAGAHIYVGIIGVCTGHHDTAYTTVPIQSERQWFGVPGFGYLHIRASFPGQLALPPRSLLALKGSEPAVDGVGGAVVRFPTPNSGEPLVGVCIVTPHICCLHVV